MDPGSISNCYPLFLLINLQDNAGDALLNQVNFKDNVIFTFVGGIEMTVNRQNGGCGARGKPPGSLLC